MESAGILPIFLFILYEGFRQVFHETGLHVLLQILPRLEVQIDGSVIAGPARLSFGQHPSICGLFRLPSSLPSLARLYTGQQRKCCIDFQHIPRTRGQK